MKRKVIPVLIGLLLIVLILAGAAGVFLFQRYSGSKEEADLNVYFGLNGSQEVAIVWNQELTEEKGLLQDERCYLKLDTVHEMLNERFYVDHNEKLLLEAKILDIALILHMEHGGGNNSSFTTRVVTSSLSDTYSVIAAAIGSLKGPRHGGANIKVVKMFEEMKEEVHDWKDDEEISRYLARLLNKDAFDHAGLIYGVGHAVYSKSDPRAVIFKGFVERLSEEKGLHDEFELYNSVERLAPAVIAKERQMYKGVSVNVDFYSGFVYKMLGLPMELYTPIFAIARMVGWSAHRMEELATNSKIIRPAYKTLCTDQPYVELSERK